METNYQFLFRRSSETEEELETLREMAPGKVHTQRAEVPPNSLVIGRFSTDEVPKDWLHSVVDAVGSILLRNAKGARCLIEN